MLELGDLEGIAADVLGATACAMPVDALRLATLCGLRVQHGRPERLDLDAGIIFVDVRARAERVQGTVAHELGHFALDRAGEADSEDAASYIGAALIAPRPIVAGHVRHAGPLDLAGLRAACPNASTTLLARRVSEVRDAVVSIVDHGRVRARVASPWLPRPAQRLDRLERLLVDGALQHEQTVRARDVVAVPLIDGRWRRVVVLRAS